MFDFKGNDNNCIYIGLQPIHGRGSTAGIFFLVCAEIGKNTVSKHQIQPECGEWAGWHGTGRLSPSRETKISGANGDREMLIFAVELTTSRIDSLTQLANTLL